MNETKFDRLVLFHLNLGSFFTKMGFIQNKTKKVISKKDAMLYLPKFDFICMTKNSDLPNGSI